VLSGQAGDAGVIAGRVVDGATGRPVAGAAIELNTLRTAVDRAGNTVELIGSRPVRSGSTTRLVPVRTGTDGQFTFTDVPGGTFVIRATRAGYLPGGYGKRRWDGLPASLVLSPGQRRGNLTVQLWKPGAISGRVRDEAGDLLVGVEVRALRRGPIGGQYKFSTASSTLTDDQGRYRFDALSPGQYLVAGVASAITIPEAIVAAYRVARDDRPSSLTAAVSTSGAPVPSSNAAATTGPLRTLEWRGPVGAVSSGAGPDDPPELAVYRTTFYPAATDPAAASPLMVDPGAALDNIDLDFHPVRSARVTGTALGPKGPMAHTGIRLVSTSADLLTSDRGFESAITATDASGRFVMLGVPPGLYTLQAMVGTHVWTPQIGTAEALLTMTVDRTGRLTAPMRPGADELLWAREIVEVGDTDARDVVLQLHAGIRLDGRVEFEGASPRPLRRLGIFLAPVDSERDGAGASVQPDEAGRFQTAPYPPGRYRIVIAAADARWLVQKILVGGRDVAFDSIDLTTNDISDVVVTMSDRKRAKISGSVQQAPDAAGSDLNIDVEVVAFPADVEAWIAAGMHQWRSQSTQTTAGGLFVLSNLPPGDYFVSAVPRDVRANLRDPALVRALAAGAERLHLEMGESRSVTLQMQRPR
jgi:hypothetical protein